VRDGVTGGTGGRCSGGEGLVALVLRAATARPAGAPGLVMYQRGARRRFHSLSLWEDREERREPGAEESRKTGLVEHRPSPYQSITEPVGRGSSRGPRHSWAKRFRAPQAFVRPDSLGESLLYI